MIASALDLVLQASTEGPGMAAAHHAREVFQKRGGEFDDGDPFFEERTQAFLDWFVLGYRDESGRTTARRYLDEHPDLAPEMRQAVVGLCRAMRGLLRIDGVDRGVVRCTDVLGGAAFAAEPLGDPAGYGVGDIADGHLVPLVASAARLRRAERGGLGGGLAAASSTPNGNTGRVVLCRGLVFHPRAALPSIEALVPQARAAGVPREELLFALLAMRMRFDRYHGIRAEKIFRYPFRQFP